MFTIRAARATLSDLPGIDTSRLSIVALQPEDADAVRRLTDDPAITAAVDFLPTHFTLQDAQDLILSGRRGQDRFLGAWMRGTDSATGSVGGDLVGVVGTHLRGAGVIEIGYWIGGAARGRGFAFEAVSAIIDLLVRRFPSRTIVAECRPANVASWGLLEKLGFRDTGEEGHRPGRRLLRRT
ncbi:GNAT family N-acetyltransferase [Methylobacterium sp. E-065]|uniref:GNAT family N-acetyltransferase n=1 Tax=Methylobacterium sp. E-065 TaxID=2836583 RepID=UPI001FBB34B8|nr:GNAT family N-acetyltransferase [Methylobacterium sp. E-065]MCJ2018428.1 GNAT family N-acetyltransferase [Methylobacterium sp. E-065]